MMNTPLLATKFHLPPWQAGSVTRVRLLEQLGLGLRENRKLTLVSAPAGYGKTTLITGWLHSLSESGLRIGWLSLDLADNDPTRFITYWLGAFQQADDTIREQIQPLLNLPQLPPIHALLDELLNALAVLQSNFILTLDDYHVISQPQIHELLEYFIDHQPAQVHLVMTTREDPPLPLARMRARRQMTEIRARDLRFTTDESRDFFNQTPNLIIDEHNLQALEKRTEGWAVGLQLAVLALQHQSDPKAFINNFRGSHRYVLDYLAEEVVLHQTAEIKQFLTQTSILESFNAEICNALTGQTDSKSMIHYLEQSNLFLVPLDDERIWYRYHHLFSDYLRVMLNEEEQNTLFKQASRWHDTNEQVEEAVHYALASKDTEFAADVIARALQNAAVWSAGKVSLLSSWLEALPQAAFETRPLLSLNASRVLYLSGRFDLAEKYVAQTEQTIKLLPTNHESEQLSALASIYRGSMAAVRGEVDQAFHLIKPAQTLLDQGNHLGHARAYFSLGLAHEISDQPEAAVDNYLRSSEEAQAAGVLFLAIHGRGAAAQVQIKQGRYRQAEQSCQAALDLAKGNRIPPLGLIYAILGGIALARNELPRAEQYLKDGIALSREGGLIDDLILGLSFQAELRAYQGDSAGTQAVFQEVNAILQIFGITRMSLLVSAYLSRIQLYLGQKTVVRQWAADYQKSRHEQPFIYADLTLVRVLINEEDLVMVPGILLPLLENANQSGKFLTAMEVMLLLAVYHQAKHETQTAQEWLVKSLLLAAPEGCRRLFMDEIERLRLLLPKVRHLAPEFVDSLINYEQASTAQPDSGLEALIDPLSQQELRVLQLIVAGKSNQEIAEELFISVGTAKWHVHNIFQKLGVSSRPQAIVRARELGFN